MNPFQDKMIGMLFDKLGIDSSGLRGAVEELGSSLDKELLEVEGRGFENLITLQKKYFPPISDDSDFTEKMFVHARITVLQVMANAIENRLKGLVILAHKEELQKMIEDPFRESEKEDAHGSQE